MDRIVEFVINNINNTKYNVIQETPTQLVIELQSPLLSTLPHKGAKERLSWLIDDIEEVFTEYEAKCKLKRNGWATIEINWREV